jgi:transposase-like protein
VPKKPSNESAHDWRALLLDLKRRGLSVAPELAVADGALGFWKALGEVWPKTREQRCWVHKTANVLNKLPKSQHPKAKRALQAIWMAETKAQAETAIGAFTETYAVKYEKAAECLKKDREALLAFYDFPAEHWKLLRTTNPIERALVQIPWMAAKLSVGVHWRIRQQAPRSTSLARFCSALEAYPMRTGLS